MSPRSKTILPVAAPISPRPANYLAGSPKSRCGKGLELSLPYFREKL